MPQKISLVVRSKSTFEIPISEGYQLYSAILNIMRESNELMSMHAHDSDIGPIAVSPLVGRFKNSDRPNHKLIDPFEQYSLNIRISDPKEIELFQAIIQSLILNKSDIKMEKGELIVEEVTNSEISFKDIVNSVQGLNNPTIEFLFKSPTCIQYKNSKVFEMFPHREAVFISLLSKWNAVCPNEMKMDIERDEIARYIIEKPDANSYSTHSVMVNTVFDKLKGHHRPILRQGFRGKCTYMFTKDAPQDVKNGILVLSKFAEYNGVGNAVSRGCGWVEVSIEEGGK